VLCPYAADIVGDASIDVVVEAMGTMDEAREVVFSALKRCGTFLSFHAPPLLAANSAVWPFTPARATPPVLCGSGKHVCTANKAMLAKNLDAVIAVCSAPGAGHLTFEPAVAGGACHCK
jgi:homoserine dehydrogenase